MKFLTLSKSFSIHLNSLIQWNKLDMRRFAVKYFSKSGSLTIQRNIELKELNSRNIKIPKRDSVARVPRAILEIPHQLISRRLPELWRKVGEGCRNGRSKVWLSDKPWDKRGWLPKQSKNRKSPEFRSINCCPQPHPVTMILVDHHLTTFNVRLVADHSTKRLGNVIFLR